MEELNMTKLERHELSAAWGDMPADQFEELKKDIKRSGVLEPIHLHSGQILDGWHRYRAAMEVGVDVNDLTFIDYSELTKRLASKHVISMNGMRRHLSASQRAAIVVQCTGWAKTGRRKSAPAQTSNTPGEGEDEKDVQTSQEMADAAGVSVRTIEDAKKAEAAGLGDDVREGKVSAKAAAETARSVEREPAPVQVDTNADDGPSDLDLTDNDPPFEADPPPPAERNAGDEADAGMDRSRKARRPKKGSREELEFELQLAQTDVDNANEVIADQKQTIRKLTADIKKLNTAKERVDRFVEGKSEELKNLKQELRDLKKEKRELLKTRDRQDAVIVKQTAAIKKAKDDLKMTKTASAKRITELRAELKEAKASARQKS